MTEKASREQFTCPGLVEGARVAVQLADGSLADGYWYDGAIHREPATFRVGFRLDSPFWPNRLPAPWRILRSGGMWHIDRRHTDHWEIHRWCSCRQRAIEIFAAGGAR